MNTNLSQTSKPKCVKVIMNIQKEPSLDKTVTSGAGLSPFDIKHLNAFPEAPEV